jgi:hypothetical protein
VTWLVLVVILAALIAAVVAVSPWRPRTTRPSGRLTAAAGMEELHGLLSLGKRYELEQRRIVYALRDENEADAPPNDDIVLDLERGTVRFNQNVCGR